MLSALRSVLAEENLQRRSLGIVFVVLALLAASYLAEKLVLSYYERNWEEVAEAKSRAQLEAVTREFVLVQRNARRIGAELARHQAVTSYLLGNSVDAAALFDRAARVAELQYVGVEIYDKNGQLIAWHGRSGTVDPHEIQMALRGELTSYVSRGPIYSHLFVITPIRIEGSYHGAVLVRKAVEVNYPLSNKFIKRAGLSEQLSRELGVNVELDYGADAELRKDERYVSSVIYGIDGRKLGVASIVRLSRSAYQEQIAVIFQKIFTGLFLVLLTIVGFLFIRWWKNLRSLLVRSILVTVLIWGVRYVFLWLEVPSLYLDLKVFDPLSFASKFGGGLAKSIGEMTLTAIALLVNVAVVLRLILVRIASARLWYPKHPLLQLVFSVVLTAFIFFALRGVAATVRSAVFDSVLQFNDPAVIIPSAELGLMVFNIVVISFCLIASAVAVTWYLLSMFETGLALPRRPATAWIAVSALFLLAGVVMDFVQESPLVSVPFRLMFGVAIILVSYRVRSNYRRGASPMTFGNAVIVLALSALFFYPVLDKAIREQDRSRIQAFAREVLRPTDGWIKHVVDESLHQFLTDEVLDAMMFGSREERERLAFTCWARSIAARQGYNCSFSLVDPEGNEISRFAIGDQVPGEPWEKSLLQDLSKSTITVTQTGSGMNTVRTYSGSIPIIAADSVLGYGVVVVTAAQQSLFRGATPTVFRTSSQENIESFYRPILLSEFRDDSLLASTADLPLGYRLPRRVAEVFRDTTRTSIWIEETIGDKEYESFFVRPSGTSRQVVGLQIEQLGMQWHLFGIVKMLVYYAIVLIGAGGVVFLIQWLRGTPYRLTFRDKLLIAFILTAFIPVGVIAIYVRIFAAERLKQNLAEHLWFETGVVEQALREHPQGDVSITSDFNYYVDNKLVLSSRPELYNSGILDRRLNGLAYAAIMLRGKRFDVEMESIGLYQYAVGYRPLLDAHQNIEGIVAVPALYRQDEIDKEVARTNAVLFGVYAVVILLVSLAATALANRIASPIQKLMQATRRVAAGDLDVKVHARADGEIGELIQSFEAMTRELKSSRQNLVQYERELAWKEMAKQVAHEIKNPLTPMKLALQHLQETYRDKVQNFDEVFREVSQMVIRQVDTLSRIASEFSHFARMPKARLELCDVNEILLDAVRLFDRDEHIEIQRQLDHDLPPVYADREELRRAFINIIRNGMQAMNNRGAIIVSTARKGGDVEVRIRDFGTGIPEEIKHKLFQPNFSTKTDGMGLGLAIVKKTIDDLNGTIEIQSEVNKGTIVIIHIPSAELAQHDSAADSTG